MNLIDKFNKPFQMVKKIGTYIVPILVMVVAITYGSIYIFWLIVLLFGGLEIAHA
jgi:hypothetical protein